MTKFIFLFCLAIPFSAFAHDGGATVIGDGGNVIVCPRKPYVRLLDIYEHAPTLGTTVTLNKELNHNQMTDELISRLAKLEWVSAHDIENVKQALRYFRYQIYDEEKDH